jgi:hypothetical protein
MLTDPGVIDPGPGELRANFSRLEIMGALSSRLTHDLSNDLMGMLAGLATLESLDSESDAHQEGVALIQTSVHRISKTITDFLEFRSNSRPALKEMSVADIVILIEKIFTKAPGWIVEKSEFGSALIKVEPRWLCCIVNQLAHLEGRSTSLVVINLRQHSSIVELAQDEVSSARFLVIKVRLDWSMAPGSGHSLDRLMLLVWNELLHQMQGWLQVSGDASQQQVSVHIPCYLN